MKLDDLMGRVEIKDEAQINLSLKGGLEIEGLGRLVGSTVYDPEGNVIPLVKTIEYVHKAGELPLIKLTCFPSKIDAKGKIQIVYVCPSCGTPRDRTRDASTHGEEWSRNVLDRENT